LTGEWYTGNHEVVIGNYLLDADIGLGGVGIGTANPSYLLDVNSNVSNAAIQVQSQVGIATLYINGQSDAYEEIMGRGGDAVIRFSNYTNNKAKIELDNPTNNFNITTYWPNMNITLESISWLNLFANQNITTNTSIIPTTNQTLDLGSSQYRFDDIYANRLVGSSSSVSGNSTSNYFVGDGRYLTNLPSSGSSGSFSDAGLLYRNGTRPLTANWNTAQYNVSVENIEVNQGITFNTTEYPAIAGRNVQARPWTPSNKGILIYEEFWGDAALTNLAILGAETIITTDTDVYGVHNFANAATNVTDGAYSVTPSTATNVGFYYIYNVTNVFETRAKFTSVTSITGQVGLFTTFTTQALYNGASCGSFFNYTRGTAGTAVWYTTTCSARYNCTSTSTTIPVSISQYATFKILPRVSGRSAWVEFYLNETLVANHTGLTHPINPACTAAWIGAWEESIEAVAKNVCVDYIYYDRVRV